MLAGGNTLRRPCPSFTAPHGAPASIGSAMRRDVGVIRAAADRLGRTWPGATPLTRP